jgi:hypothetical protein
LKNNLLYSVPPKNLSFEMVFHEKFLESKCAAALKRLATTVLNGCCNFPIFSVYLSTAEHIQKLSCFKKLVAFHLMRLILEKINDIQKLLKN